MLIRDLFAVANLLVYTRLSERMK